MFQLNGSVYLIMASWDQEEQKGTRDTGIFCSLAFSVVHYCFNRLDEMKNLTLLALTINVYPQECFPMKMNMPDSLQVVQAGAPYT